MHPPACLATLYGRQTRLAPAAVSVSEVLMTCWEEPVVQVADQLAAAQAVAECNCAYLRCANLEG